jgi:hypothetical protein
MYGATAVTLQRSSSSTTSSSSIVRNTAVKVQKAISMCLVAAVLLQALLPALNLLVLRNTERVTAQLVVVGCGGCGLFHTPGGDLFMADPHQVSLNAVQET